MNKKLDLKNTRIYSSTMGDILYALMHVGEEVYLSDDEDFNTFTKGKLIGVRYISDWAYSTYTEYPFVGSSVEDGGLVISKYFILAKDAKFKEEEKEKILRPFKDVIEFRTVTGRGIGGVITYKKKNNDAEYTVLINGYVRLNDNVLGIYLGRRSYTFKELRDDYLYLHVDASSSEWKPFGIIE